MAPTIAHLPEISVVVQQSISGRPLDSLLVAQGGNEDGAAEAVRLAASALAQLHRGPTVSTRMRPVEKELHRFRARALRIGSVDSQRGDQLLGVAERLLQTYSAFPVSPPGVVHGDCKPSQFLLRRRTVRSVLLDFDHCGVWPIRPATWVPSWHRCGSSDVQRTIAGASAASTAGLDALAEQFIDDLCASRWRMICRRGFDGTRPSRSSVRRCVVCPVAPVAVPRCTCRGDVTASLDRVMQELS